MNMYLKKLANKEDLTAAQMTEVMEQIMQGKLSDIEIAGILTALSVKGETPAELIGGATVMRQESSGFKLDVPCLDTCGTGGDHSSTFNISTAVAIVSAACGIPVVKHGNRSITSKSGSADVLEALGVNISLTPEEVKSCIEQTNIGFFFAPTFHPAMKYVMPVRKALGIRTIFNLLGPLSNPAHATYQLLGVYKDDLLEPFAHTLRGLGVKRAMIAHGSDGLDEITITGSTKVAELKDDIIKVYDITPEEFGLSSYDAETLKGGEAKENAEIIIKVFQGEIGARRDIVLLNTAVALYVSEKVETIKEGIKFAAHTIDTGLVMAKLNELKVVSNSF